MKAQNYRTTTQANSGHAAANRRRTNSATGSAGRSRKSRRTGKKNSGSRNGARVIMMLVTVGGIIAVGFVLAQHSLINTLQFKRAEEGLKSELDTLSSQQRYYTFKKEQALSTQESDKAAKESGLIQPGLGRDVAQNARPQIEPKTQAQSAQPKAASSELMSSRLATKAADKTNGSAKSPGKALPPKKQPEHKSNVVKVVKVTNKANPAAKPDKAKPGNSQKDNRQVAKNQKPQKDQKEMKRQR